MHACYWTIKEIESLRRYAGEATNMSSIASKDFQYFKVKLSIDVQPLYPSLNSEREGFFETKSLCLDGLLFDCYGKLGGLILQLGFKF